MAMDTATDDDGDNVDADDGDVEGDVSADDEDEDVSGDDGDGVGDDDEEYRWTSMGRSRWPDARRR